MHVLLFPRQGILDQVNLEVMLVDVTAVHVHVR